MVVARKSERMFEKMDTRYLALLSAASIFIFFRVVCAERVITCKLPQKLTVQLSSSKTAHIYESDLAVSLENNGLILTSYAGMNSINIQANNVDVRFHGFMNIENGDPSKESSTDVQIISETYTNRISGIALRKSVNSSDIVGCRIVVLSTEMDRPGKAERLANEIRRLAESCIELELCRKIGGMEPQYMATMPDEGTADFLSVCPDPLVIVGEGCERYYDTDTIQPMINKGVDVGLAKLREKLRAINNGIYPIPNIEKDFSTGSGIFKTHGRFTATKGTFRDLTTVRRISDVRLSHDGMKLMVACEFGLHIAKINFPRYDVKYGIIKVDGRMSGSVNDTALAMRVALDYNTKPCQLSMDYLKVTEFGNMKIDLTGLGSLNWMVTKLLNWITTTWREEIVVTLENELRAAVKEQLSSVDCEIFRP